MNGDPKAVLTEQLSFAEKQWRFYSAALQGNPTDPGLSQAARYWSSEYRRASIALLKLPEPKPPIPSLEEIIRNETLRRTQQKVEHKAKLEVLKPLPTSHKSIEEMFPKSIKTQRQWKNEQDYKKQKTRKAAIIEKLGARCVDCGSTTRLELDHIDGCPVDLSNISVSKQMDEYERAHANNELAVRCRSCNASLGVKKFQGNARYKK